jgi:tetratricopeptide (TPR) repeat protein
MEKGFLDLARQGKNAWWRYTLSILLILFAWLGLSILLGVLLGATVVLDNNPGTYIDRNAGRIVGVDSSIIVTLSLLPSIALVVSLFAGVRFIHRRPFLSLITPHPRLDWKRTAVGFGFYLFLVAAATLVEAVLCSGCYQFTFNTNEFLKFIPAILLLLPIQTTAEELLFRGYLMQSIGLLTRRPIIPAIVSSLIFMLLHLANPEVKADFILMPAYYFGVGLLFALVALRDNRLELAIGAHAGTVLFTAIFVNYANSVIPTPAMFTAYELDVPYALASFVVVAIIFYAGLFLRKRTASFADSMSPDNLNRAIAAIKAGDEETGKRLLARVLTADPRNDTAWVWMSEVVPPDRQRECLERALAANPANEAAKRGLAMLKSTPSPSAVATHRAGEELERFASPPAPVEPPLTTETPLPPIEEPQLAVDTLSSPSAEQPDTPSVAKRRWPLLAIAGVVVLCLCGALAGGGYWWYTSTSAVVIQGGPQAQAQALYNEGHGLYQTGKYEAALDKLQAALELYRETGNRQGEGRTLNDIGGVYKCLGQYQEALECLEEALAISREIGDRQCEVSALNNIGEAYESSSQYSEALKHLEEALAISREVGDRQGEGQTLANIGWVYTDLGQYQDALKYSEEALAISRETGDRRVEGRAFNTIGTVYFHLKQYQEALGYFEKALAARREAGDRRGEASTLGNIGLMYDDLGQDQKALKYQEEALATKREIGDRQGEALTLSNIGLLYDFHGDHQKGLDYYKEALAVAREIGDRQVESNALSLHFAP